MLQRNRNPESARGEIENQGKAKETGGHITKKMNKVRERKRETAASVNQSVAAALCLCFSEA